MSTYDDFLVYDVVSLVVVEREKVREDAHHDDGRDPDEDVRDHHWDRGPDAIVSCHGHCERVDLGVECRCADEAAWIEDI